MTRLEQIRERCERATKNGWADESANRDFSESSMVDLPDAVKALERIRVACGRWGMEHGANATHVALECRAALAEFEDGK